MIHFDEAILGADVKIDQHIIDLVARLGGNWYSKITADSLFEVVKPITTLGIGVDALPDVIKYSKILTGNHLGQLGNVMHLPSDEEVDNFSSKPEIKEILDATIGDSQTRTLQLHLKAVELLNSGGVNEAWKVLLIN